MSPGKVRAHGGAGSAAQRGPPAAGGGTRPGRAGRPRRGFDAGRGYSHEVGPVAVQDGTEGEAVAEGGGHVGDADIAVALALLLAPQLQVLDGRHGLDGPGEAAGGPAGVPGRLGGSPSLRRAEPGRRQPACGGEEAGKGAGEGRAAAPQGLSLRLARGRAARGRGGGSGGSPGRTLPRCGTPHAVLMPRGHGKLPPRPCTNGVAFVEV